MDATKLSKPPPEENIDDDPRKALLATSPRLPWVTQLAARLFPAGFGPEAKRTWALAWPAILCSIFTVSTFPVAVLFTGHLGKTELGAVALANSMIGVTGIYVCFGLATACDTLFSQAYGSGRLKMMGIYLQRSFQITLLLYVALCGLYLNAEPLFRLLHQHPTVSRVAAEYMTYFLPGLLFNFCFLLMARFLQSQNRVLPTLIVAILGNVVNALLQYLFVFAFSCGTRGSAVGQALSWLFMAIAICVYTRQSGLLHDTWPGWSWRSMENWGEFALLAAAGVVQVSAEADTFDAGIFISGAVGIVAQGAISISLQIDLLLNMIPLGYGIACSVRVGHCLGAGDAAGAKTAYRVAFLLCGVTEVGLVITLLSVRNVIGRAFTDDQDVVSLVGRAVGYMTIVICCDIATGVSSGALRGCGLQWVGGWLHFTGYVVIAIPAIIGLVFYTSLRALGFWVGMIMGTVPIGVVYVIVLCRLDWQHQADKATTGRETLDENNARLPDSADDLDTEDEIKSRLPSHKTRLLIKRAAACSLSAGIFISGIVCRVLYDTHNK